MLHVFAEWFTVSSSRSKHLDELVPIGMADNLGHGYLGMADNHEIWYVLSFYFIITSISQMSHVEIGPRGNSDGVCRNPRTRTSQPTIQAPQQVGRGPRGKVEGN